MITVFTLSFWITHYFRLVFNSRTWNGIGVEFGQMGLVSNCRQSYQPIKDLLCHIIWQVMLGHALESQVVKQGSAFIPHSLSVLPCLGNAGEFICPCSGGLRTHIVEFMSLNPKMHLSRVVHGDLNSIMAAQLSLTNPNKDKHSLKDTGEENRKRKNLQKGASRNFQMFN